MSKLPTFSILILLTCLWQMSCYEPQEGCLDIRSSNFDIDADDACGDCCTFPVLKVQVQHEVDLPDSLSVNFRYETFYPNPGNLMSRDSFLVDRSSYFFSNLRLIKEGGEEVGVIDTMEVEIPAGTKATIEDSFVRVDRDNFQTRTVGHMLTEGVFTGVKFTVGLDEYLQQIEPTTVPVGHPLSTASDVGNYDTLAGNYIPNRLIFRRDTTAGFDSLEIRFFEPLSVTLPFDAPIEITQGFDINLTLKVDYLEWFSGVDMESADLQTIQAVVQQNLPSAISVTEISQ